MKFVFFVLALTVAVAFADTHAELGAVHPSGSGYGGPGTDANVFDQPYDFTALINGFAHTEMVDDFILGSDATIQAIQMWLIYSGSNPTTTELFILEDSGDSDPATATEIWRETVDCTHIDTGDDQWGFDIWETTYTLTADAYPDLTAGTRYWLGLVFQLPGGGQEYWLVEDPVWGSYLWTTDGTTWWRSDSPDTFAQAADAFFALYDSPVALQRDTWGSIKSIF